MREIINNKILTYLNEELLIQFTDLHNFNIKTERIDHYLINNNLISENTLLKIYQYLFNLKIVDLSLINLEERVIKLFSLDFIDKYKIIPISISSDKVVIGITDPFDIINLAKVNCFIKDLKIEYVLCSKTEVLKLKQTVFSTTSRKTLVEEYGKNKENNENLENSELNNITSSHIVRLADSIINEAICLFASDIHLEPFEDNVRVRYRIDGSLITTSTISKEIYKALISRIKILSGIDISKTLVPQDGRISYQYNNNEYDIRVSTLPVINGERIVLRILDSKSFNYNIENIGFKAEDLEYIKKIINLPYGIILLTGPTGSGKSTSLYVFLKELITKDLNIITIEDPVEYNIPGINQIQVNNKTNLTFAVGLRSILRQDPNVIMLGEIRDEETASIAVRASITGHLVFATLHTNTATSSINRLLDMGVKPYFASDALISVINQRLIKKLCPHCKKKYLITEEEQKILDTTIQELYKPCGCPACNNTGYKGRMMVYEILKVNDKVKKLITEGASTLDIQKLINKNGFVSITSNTKKLVLEGKTSINEFLKIKYEINE